MALISDSSDSWMGYAILAASSIAAIGVVVLGLKAFGVFDSTATSTGA